MAVGRIIILLATLTALASVHAAWAAESYPPAIAKLVDADVKSCPAGRQAGRVQDGYVTAADFNGDGVDDYVFDNNRSNCFDVILNCGSAGCPASAMISSGKAFKTVEIGHIQGWAIVQQDGRAGLRLGVHGSSCDRPGATNCSRVLFWNGSGFVGGPAKTGGAAKVAPNARGAQPDNVRPYGEWVALDMNGKCPDGGQGIVIEPSRIVVDYGGDVTTFKPTALTGCKGDVCVFSQPGLQWTVTRRGPDRILFEGPHNRKVSDRSEAQRHRSAPGCSRIVRAQ
ncbi:hypothetical protein [Methylopila sp. M107]|uniref:hypothetical protein n=1 Tax=Methylopila sp. M107 TaxID=1101190 RepID=UPI00037A8074|nr:hypothetical protein [Methylopila sp. M107]